MRTHVCTALLTLLLACGGGGAAGHLESARAGLESGDFAGAVAAADAGLRADADEATTWQLELIRLEAQASGAMDAETVATLERLAGSHPAGVNAALYVTTAARLEGAGGSFVGVLDAGAKRFPENTEVANALEGAKKDGTPETLDLLRTLGYLDLDD